MFDTNIDWQPGEIACRVWTAQAMGYPVCVYSDAGPRGENMLAMADTAGAYRRVFPCG